MGPSRFARRMTIGLEVRKQPPPHLPCSRPSRLRWAVELSLIFTGRALRRTFPMLALLALCALPAAAQFSGPIPADVCVDSTPGTLWKAAPMSSAPASAAQANQTSAETARVIQQLMALRYPELNPAQVKVRTFHSDYDYFRTRFSLGRFLLCAACATSWK
jgi:hypothetical protein